MRAATLFSGIGAPEVAMPSWRWLWCAELERFACAVLAARHSATPNMGDVTDDDFLERAAAAGRPDVIVFGSPCQDFSVAGGRLGLVGARGNLTLVALGIVARLEPRWFVVENVPGLLSSAGGRDFGLFLRAVDDAGYCGAWAVLDAQWFGVAQRRERVFFVGHAGDWRGPAAVLLEPEGLCGDSPPRRGAGAGVAESLASRAGGGGWPDGGDGRRNQLIAEVADLISGSEAHTYTHEGKGNFRLHNVVDQALAFGGNDTRGPIEVATARNGHHGPHGRLDFESETFAVCHARVRRLTPRECERLQGFPDDYTLVTYRRRPAADGPRYRALGNAMAVPVMRWILRRLEAVDAIMREDCLGRALVGDSGARAPAAAALIARKDEARCAGGGHPGGGKAVR